MDVQTIHAVYAKIENRPGTLERVARLLGERRINIDAVSAETIGNVGVVRFATPKPREAVEILRSANIEAYESEVVVVHLQNRPNELAKACGELAAASVNIEAVLTTPEGRIGFRTSDNELAARILGKL